MDATAGWDATRALRAWERERLRLSPGERLLDVGCGLGEAARALTEDLGPEGEAVGIDASAAMLAVARERSIGSPCPMGFSVGDALALDEPDRSFDAARSERVLQWLTDPQTAVCELARVLRPGGRVSLIDTDWSTLRIDVRDSQVEAKVRSAMAVERRRPSNIGSRLGDLVDAAGFRDCSQTSATQVWTHWDPDKSPAPDGCFSMRSLAEDLVAADQLVPAEADQFVATVQAAARSGRFSMSLTMFAVVAKVPDE